MIKIIPKACRAKQYCSVAKPNKNIGSVSNELTEIIHWHISEANCVRLSKIMRCHKFDRKPEWGDMGLLESISEADY